MMSPVPAVECQELLALRQGVYSRVTPDDVLHLIAWPHAEELGVLSAGQRAVLRLLAKESRALEELIAVGRDYDGDKGADLVGPLLVQLRAGGWLKVTVTWEGRDLYCLEPIRAPRPHPEKTDSDLVLSRFVMLRRQGGAMVAESPRAWCDVRVLDPAVLSVFAELAAAGPAAPAGPEPPEPPAARLPRAASQRLLGDLHWAEIAVPVPDVEDTELRLRQWSPHELWFHQRTRVGERGYFGMSFGRTSWAKGTFEPLPARRAPYPGPAIDLYRPDLDKLRDTDPTLTAILEDRQSIRRHDQEPLSADQLGEFLYRCARTRGTRTANGVEYASRPHPSGGGVYELELYPVVRQVAGLDPGLYHYDSHEHQLRHVQAYAHPATRRLLAVAKIASLMEEPPQMMIVIAARVGRLMWTYESMPYAMILKHVGVLYQTMYCVATAMDLAPCGMGSGDSVAFTEATGMDPFTECSVGEFVLGRRHRDVPPRRSPS
jgi:SagB-type dehydrogenase family enzyme